MALLVPPVDAEHVLNVLALPPPSEPDALGAIRAALKQADAQLLADFRAGVDIARLVSLRGWAVEQAVLNLWQRRAFPARGLALVAVGGFGRGDMQPHSDVDLLILSETPGANAAIEQFVRDLWDAGLEPGHAVRTVDECVEQARNDVTVATNLMEARFITGDKPLYKAMRAATDADHIWPGREFFQAKYAEQQRRHKTCGDSAYHLEPNIKEGPGGLRDIQMVQWVAQRHYRVASMHGLVDAGFLREHEYMALDKGRHWLWQVRFALHSLAQRKEDRLLFDQQKGVAELLGYRDAEHQLAVERFMQDYYRNAMRLERLNLRLLQLFKENILTDGSERVRELPSKHFRAVNDYIDINDPALLARDRSVWFELFHLLQSDAQLEGVRANTARHIRLNLAALDDDFRSDAAVRAQFIRLFDARDRVYLQLVRMSRLGILPRYLPNFARIVGRMQYDLFHIYTVDEHTLFVIRNLEAMLTGDSEHALANRIAARVAEPRALYLAGLFHDIGKGRGGDHSAIGAADAREFSRAHALPEAQGELIAWLVANHLLMSVVAQKQDLSDAQVLDDFARHVGEAERLDALYLLTVADITGTNPNLWNSFKDSLLQELYLKTADRLGRAGEEALLDRRAASLPPDAERIAAAGDAPAQLIRRHDDGLEFSVQGDDFDGLFRGIALIIGAHRFEIVSADLKNLEGGRVADTFHCLGEPEAARVEALLQELSELMRTQHSERAPRQHRMPRRDRHFTVQPQIKCSPGRNPDESRLDLVCTNHPGLLIDVSGVFLEFGIAIHGAKVATFGTRVEDVFWVSHNGRALDSALERRLKTQLMDVI